MDRKAAISPCGWGSTRAKLVLWVKTAFLHMVGDAWTGVVFVALVVAVVGLTLELAWMFEAREATALTCLGLGLVVGIILGWRGK